MTAPTTTGTTDVFGTPARTGSGRTVVGDGTTVASRTRSRWQRWRFAVALAGLVAVVAIAAALPQPAASNVSLAPDNPGRDGAQALAQILGQQGVEVRYTRSFADATRAAAAGTTLLLANGYLLGDSQVATLAATEADIVLVEPDEYLLGAMSPAAGIDPVASGTSPTVREPGCSDPDAVAAGSVRAAGAGYIARTDAAVVCYPGAEGALGTYLVVEGSRRVVAIGDQSILTNASLASAGNAALALRTLGRNASLTWYLPSLGDYGLEPSGPSLTDLIPGWVPVIGLELLLVAAVAGLWRGRRLGRLVTEPLPVTVRAAETTRGRGRLYRRARSYGHAAAALRAGAATRSATRVGLPRTAAAPAMIDALARATGRRTDEVADLLYGPPPTDDAGLELLARRLDDLESEVHRL